MGSSADGYKVHEIVALKRDGSAEAEALLLQAASQVQPIMRKRQWRVPLLSEFMPRNPNLLGLNVNRGQEIKIRLRPHHSPNAFFPFDHILGTMLHELVHIVHGPHNANFYKLLEELTAECEELMAKGISGTGQGFDAASVGRLGSYSFIPQHNPADHKMKDYVRKVGHLTWCICGPCKPRCMLSSSSHASCRFLTALLHVAQAAHSSTLLASLLAATNCA
jgi:hypothetical protein